MVGAGIALLQYVTSEFVQIPPRRPPPGALRAGREGSFLGAEWVFRWASGDPGGGSRTTFFNEKCAM